MHSAVFWLGFPALLLCNVFEGTRGSWLDGDFGVDRPGGDLPGMPVSLDPGQSATDCGSLCWSHSHCMAWSFSSAGCSGTDVSLCSLKARVTEQSYNPCTVSGVKNSGLLTSVFRSLPLGAVQPTGWLREQLALQASGLSGHLPFFWPDVMNSSWMGGRGDTGLHERTPYWLNGFIPLAYQLQDPSLIHTVRPGIIISCF
jgi:hypothetical protein